MTPPTQHLARRLLRTYLLPYWRVLLVLLVLLTVSSGLTLLSPRILAAFIDVVFGRSDRSLWMLGGAFLSIAVLGQVITIASSYLGTDIGLRATNRLRTDLTLHCLELDMSFHKRSMRYTPKRNGCTSLFRGSYTWAKVSPQFVILSGANNLFGTTGRSFGCGLRMTVKKSVLFAQSCTSHR